jgi:dihydrodipicolinate synthase/N-acetylneuraminate lyase
MTALNRTSLDRTTLHGVWGTVLLPLGASGQIEVPRLQHELEVLTSAGLDGIYAHGTAGEFHELDEDEYDLVNGLVARHAVAAGVPFQLGAGHMSARLSLDRVRRAARLGPDAIQVILPDWVPIQPDEAIAALAGLAAAAGDIPLVLYNPPHAKTQLDVTALLRAAAEVPQLIGIKVAGGDAAWYRAMRPVLDTLAVFVAGHTLASGLAQGAAGAYSNVACLSPAGAVAWSAMMHSDPARAEDTERRLQRFLAEHITPLQRRGYGNPALDKTLAHVGGWARIGTRLRWPYRGVPEAEAAALRPAARAAVPELLPDPPGPQLDPPPDYS